MIGDRAFVRVRRAGIPDCEELANVFRDSWRHAYTGIIPRLHLEQLIQARGPDWWKKSVKSTGHLLILEASDKIVGYATCGPARRNTRHRGEIFELYLTPVYQGIGLGEHLFEACRAQLDVDRLQGLVVWALADNNSACDFYWRRGGRPVAQTKEMFGQSQLLKIGYGWT